MTDDYHLLCLYLLLSHLLAFCLGYEFCSWVFFTPMKKIARAALDGWGKSLEREVRHASDELDSIIRDVAELKK